MTTSPSPVAPRSSRTRLVTLVVTAVCLVLGPLAFAPAQAAGTGSITGTVVESTTQTPILGAVVEAFAVNGTAVATTASFTTESDETGAFSLTDVSPGQFVLRITDVNGNHVAVSETVQLLAGEQKSLGVITMDVGASITGTVVGDDHLPVEYAYVYALGDVDGTQVRYQALTDEDGAYEVRGLPGGSYTVQFFANNSGYFDEFYNDEPTAEAADSLPVASGSTNPLGTTSLAVAVPVRGLVTDAAGARLGGVPVAAYRSVDGVVAAQKSANGVTSGDGSFSLRLPPGTYRLTIGDGTTVYRNPDGDIRTIEAGEEPDAGTFVRAAVPAPYTPPAVVKKSASVRVSAKGAKKKATLAITVKASGVTPTGKVTIKLGSKTLKTVTLKHGKAKVTLKKQKKGKRTYKVIYSGDSKVRAKTVNSKKVKIK